MKWYEQREQRDLCMSLKFYKCHSLFFPSKFRPLGSWMYNIPACGRTPTVPSWVRDTPWSYFYPSPSTHPPPTYLSPLKQPEKWEEAETRWEDFSNDALMNTVTLWGEETLSQERYSLLLGDLCDPTQNDGFSYFTEMNILYFRRSLSWNMTSLKNSFLRQEILWKNFW